MSLRLTGCLIVAVAVLGARVDGQAPDKAVRGSDVSVELVSRSRSVLRGELIAVSLDSIWLLSASGLATAPLGNVRSASLKQHSLDGKAGLIWTLVGGLVTGGLLTGACSTIEQGCGSVFLGTMAAWAIVGGVSAASLELSSRRTFKAPDIGGKLRAYSRFPQGLPPGIDRGVLGLQLSVRALVPRPW